MNLQKTYELRLAEETAGATIKCSVQPNRPGLASPERMITPKRSKKVA